MLTKAETQRLRSLRDKKRREELGLFVIEGEKVVAELLAADFPFLEIYATDGWPDREASTNAKSVTGAAKVIEISAEEMARASHFPTPSAVLAVGRITRESLPSGALDRGLTLALDGVQDPGNVGTLLRVADWFALARVLVSPDCADLFHQKVINASMGSFARVQVHTCDLPAALKGASVPVLGADLSGENIHQVAAVRDAIVVIGSEGRGLSPLVKNLVTRFVTIPRLGAAESLNAGIAAAIICDNLRRSGVS